MDFVILKEEEFDSFAKNHEHCNFHQTTSWGKLKETNGWKSHLVGIKERKKVIAASLILSKKLPFGNMFYAPRGFLIDFKDSKLLEFFIKELKKYLKNENAIFLKIDPYIPYRIRDINGTVITENGTNDTAINNLKSVGFKHFGFNLYHEALQPRFMFRLKVENKTEDDLFKGMEPTTRNLVRKSLKIGIETRELKENELEIFKNLMSHTSERRNFIDRPFSYYKDMYKHLTEKNIIKFMISEINLDKYIKRLKEETKETETIIKEKEHLISDGKVNENKTRNIIKELEVIINSNNKNIEQAKKIKEKKGSNIVLGGILYFTYGNEVLSLLSGAYNDTMNYNSPYLLNFEMIKYAMNNDYKYYNFYGITGDFNKDSELYGMYDFKRGFGGEVVELIGEFDLVINKFKFFLYKYSYKLYRIIKK